MSYEPLQGVGRSNEGDVEVYSDEVRRLSDERDSQERADDWAKNPPWIEWLGLEG